MKPLLMVILLLTMYGCIFLIPDNKNDYKIDKNRQATATNLKEAGIMP